MSDWNDKVIAQFRTNGGEVDGFGKGLVLLHSVGAKSGAERLSPVAGMPVDGGWLVTASKAGAPEHPAWYHNLKADPDVSIEVAGEADPIAVTANDLEGADYDAAWATIVSRAPGFAEYQKKTTRRIPVFLLTRR